MTKTGRQNHCVRFFGVSFLFWNLKIRISNLFRVSCFVLRILFRASLATIVTPATPYFPEH